MMGWKKNADIGLCSALMILFATSVLYLPDGDAIRFAIAVPALFFIPGYLLLSMLWPTGDMPLEERIAMSVAMSLIVDVAAGLSLSILAYISLTTVMATLLSSVALMIIITMHLRSRYVPEEKTDKKESGGGGEDEIEGKNIDYARSITARIPAVLLIFAVIAATAAVLPYYNQQAEIDSSFSNLYLCDENHTADNLPEEINRSTEIIVGVRCMEEGGSDYSLHIWFSNETMENNNSINMTLEEKNFTLQQGQNMEINVTISPEKLRTMLAGVNDTSSSSITTCFHGTYRIGASLDIGQDGTVENTVWLRVSISEG